MQPEDKYEIGSEYSAYFDKEPQKLNGFDDSKYHDHPETSGSISWLPKLFLILSLVALITYAICQILP